jgi:hypothetical protein
MTIMYLCVECSQKDQRKWEVVLPDGGSHPCQSCGKPAVYMVSMHDITTQQPPKLTTR